MNRRARTPLLSVFLLVLTAFAASDIPSAQVVMQPTPSPTVTAENEQWYLKGEPITYAGNLYYPSGAQIFFSPNEMVRSGFYQGIPLYARTTIEPYSIVYVPLAGGRMQPYERPRSGEIAGTAGSTPTTLPTPAMTVPPAGAASQAAGPPSETVRVVPVFVPSRPEVEGTSGTPSEAPAAVSTGGRTSSTVRRDSQPDRRTAAGDQHDLHRVRRRPLVSRGAGRSDRPGAPDQGRRLSRVRGLGRG